MMPNRLRSLLFLVLSALASSCAWGYAGEDGEIHVEPEPETRPQVVELEDKNNDRRDSQAEPLVRESDAPQVAEPQSPCGVNTFRIRRYSTDRIVEKTIDCGERKVINVKRMPMSNAQFQQARQDGLPEGRWYLLVDPEGLRAKFLSNAELIKLSKHFNVKFLRKDRRRSLLIYEYRDAVR